MDQEEQPIKSTTRTFRTSEGEVDYAKLSDLIAPNLLSLLDDIHFGKYHARNLDEALIQEFHRRIVGEIIPEIAGEWRKVLVGVGNWIPPEPYEIPEKMREYTLTLQERIKHADSLELQIEALAFAEGEFLHIHPFKDFNGRTARVILAELLARFDLPPVDTSVDRNSGSFKEYQRVLAEYDNGRMGDLTDFWGKRLSSFDSK